MYDLVLLLMYTQLKLEANRITVRFIHDIITRYRYTQKDSYLRTIDYCKIQMADSVTSQAKHAYPNRENYIDLTDSV
jgi:hypothetical protein